MAKKRAAWSEGVGERPNTVRVREERAPGDAVYLRWTNPDGTAGYQSLGYGVRDARGRFDPDVRRRALEAGRDKSAELRIARLREQTVAPARLTVGQAWDRYTDAERGGLPESYSARRMYRAAAVAWTNYIGAARPWNSITPAEVEALAFKLKAEGTPAKAESFVRVLRACHYWLKRKAGFRGLENPTETFDWRRLRAGTKPRRPRYSEAEIRALLAVRDQVDPRFALFLALVVHSGARGTAVRTAWRSAVDQPLEVAPAPEQAPAGWIVMPALKGQAPVPVFLTRFARRELDKAFAGSLRELEDRYQERGVDYPLFPASRKLSFGQPVAPALDPWSYRTIGPSTPKQWLADAERAAGVEHVEHRAWHGLRRAWSDRIYAAAGLDVVTSAGGWADRTIPERVYLDTLKHRDRDAARRALEPGEPTDD
jgi:hypothetical protein